MKYTVYFSLICEGGKLYLRSKYHKKSKESICVVIQIETGDIVHSPFALVFTILVDESKKGAAKENESHFLICVTFGGNDFLANQRGCNINCPGDKMAP